MVLIRHIYSIINLPITVFSVSVSSSSDSNKYFGQTALYWGQASAQQQNRLRYYCDADSVDIFLLSFLTDFPNSQKSIHGYTLNLADACTTDTWDSYASTPNCSQVGEDIKYCQSLGKKVLMSLGGESGEYGFTSESQAVNFADVLWNSFGGGSDYPQDERPFGDATVDGFDFDLENQNQIGCVSLAKRLQNLSSGDSTKDYLLTSAPQCPFPDQSNGDLIDGVELDYLFVQFYNNDCGLSDGFNFDTWAQYMKSKNYEKTKLFIGLPATSNSASSGYVDSDLVLEKIEEIWSNDTLREYFGGVMFWDASQAFGYSTSDINSLDDNLVTKISSSFQKGSSSESSTSSTVTVTISSSSVSSNSTNTKNSGASTSKASYSSYILISIMIQLVFTGFFS